MPFLCSLENKPNIKIDPYMRCCKHCCRRAEKTLDSVFPDNYCFYFYLKLVKFVLSNDAFFSKFVSKSYHNSCTNSKIEE